MEMGGIPLVKKLKFFSKSYSCVLCNPNSDPLSSDYDGDGFADDVDPDPFTYIKIKDFGSDSYISDIQNKASIGNPFDNSGFDPFWDSLEYTLIERGSKVYIAHQAIDLMMQDVNTYEDYTFTVSDENWLKFCEFFNECVMDYGSITKELHYFRLKLNRTPDSFKELVDNKDNWYLYDKSHTAYHMNDSIKNDDFTSSNPKYPDCKNLQNNIYNMKFVDKYGMNEVVVTPKDINSDLTKPENWLILTDDYEKAKNNPQTLNTIL